MSHMPRSGRTLSVLAAASLLWGCAPSGPIDEAEQAQSESAALSVATITFDGAWGERLEGVLAEGGVVHLRYDESRLPACQSVQQGVPQYAITAHARVGGEVQSVVVAGLGASDDPQLELDAAGERSRPRAVTAVASGTPTSAPTTASWSSRIRPNPTGWATRPSSSIV